MSNYSSLKATINANVKTNGNQEITGQVMNAVLNAMVNSLGSGYQYMGIATPTNPGTNQTPDDRCFYIATTPGTYSHLGGLVVNDGEVAILKYDSAWSKEVTGAATAAQVTQLGREVEDINADLAEVVEKTAVPSINLLDLSTADLGKALTSGASAMTLANYKTYETTDSQINTLAPIVVPANKYIVISYTTDTVNPNASRRTGTFKNFIRFDNDGNFLSRSFSQGVWQNTTGNDVSVVVGIYDESVSGSYYNFAMIEVNDDGVPSETYVEGGYTYHYDIKDTIPTRKTVDDLEEQVDRANDAFGSVIEQVNMSDCEVGYYIDRGTGAKTANENYNISNPILLYPGDKITAHLYGQYICLLAQTDSEGTSYSVLIRVDAHSGYNDIEYTAQDKMYVALCWNNTDGNDYANITRKARLSLIAEETKKNRSDIDNLIDGGIVADYFKDEIESVADDVYNHATNPCLIFNVITDTHLDKNNAENARRNKESVENIAALNRLVRSDGVIHLGDILSVSMNTETTDTIYQSIGEYITSLYNAGVKVFPVIGNHDGPSVNAFNPNRWDAVAGRLADDYTIHPSPATNGNGVKYWPAYYYRDFPQMNVRCIFLSTPDSDEQYTYAISPKQMKWFAEEALNVEAGTQIIIFAHEAPFDTDVSSKTTQYSVLVNVCNAFANKTTYTKTDGGWNINVDYTSTTGAKICGYFCGHQHFDNVANPGWTYEGLSNTGQAHSYVNEFSFPVVNIGAGLMTNAGSNTFGGTAPSRTDKTATQDLWDTIIYRPDVSKFYLVRFGAGSNREVDIP